METKHGDSDDQHRLKNDHGRGMNTLHEHYKLPADREEMDRLSLQHRMWLLIVRGLYPPALESTVKQALNVPQPTILDAGCGSADWAIQMAALYPEVHVIGVDLSRSFHERPPANFQFVQMDITENLPPCRSPDGYAVIHARSVTGHLKNPGAFIAAAYAALRPGGLLILGDGVPGRVLDNKKENIFPRFPPATATDIVEQWPAHGSWFAGWQDLWVRIACSHYQTVDSLFESSHFSVIFSQRYVAPVGWSGENIDDGEELGKIMSENSRKFVSSCMPTVLAYGEYSPVDVSAWVSAITREIEAGLIYVGWDLAVGQKPVQALVSH
ncbi:S-adenosyl-L-methionine-dependent methyltransferase [Mycena latifolia]|nr:S-adenosyl-L-methionine-dependent methyltransferase [Mycena latifolia]